MSIGRRLCRVPRPIAGLQIERVEFLVHVVGDVELGELRWNIAPGAKDGFKPVSDTLTGGAPATNEGKPWPGREVAPAGTTAGATRAGATGEPESPGTVG